MLFDVFNKEKAIRVFAKLMLALMVFSITITAIGPMKAEAHNAYFLGIYTDFSNFKYMSTITYDKNNSAQSNHTEYKLGDFNGVASINNDRSDFTLPSISDNSESTKDAYDDFIKKGSGKTFLYSFPGTHVDAWSKSITDATAKDLDRATWVATNLITSLNDGIDFIMYQSGYNPKNDSSSGKVRFLKLSTDLANRGKSGGELTFNGNKFTVTRNPDVARPLAELTKANYVRITAPSGDFIDVIYSVPKGYTSGQALYSSLPEEVKSNNDYKKESKELNWKHVVLQGNYNFYVEGVTIETSDTITKPNVIEQKLAELFQSLINGIRVMLGLHSFQELMLNDGSRASSYYYGIMPNGWYHASLILYWVCQIIAWIMVIGAIVKLLVTRNLSAINPTMRVNMIEGIKNLLITGFALTLILPLFHVMARMNMSLVDIFAKSSTATTNFGTAMSTFGGNLAGLLIDVMFLIALIYFNFVYIVRAITGAFLLGISPLCVVSIAYGGRYKDIFGSWMREMVGNIFMQSFHAICIAFLSMIEVSGSSRLIEEIVIVYSFVPLTQFFKSNIMGLKGSFAENVGDKISQTAQGLGRAVVGGTVGGLVAGKSGGSADSIGNFKNKNINTGGNNNEVDIKDRLENADKKDGIVKDHANDAIPGMSSNQLGDKKNSIPSTQYAVKDLEKKKSASEKAKDYVDNTKNVIADRASNMSGKKVLVGALKGAGKAGLALAQAGHILGSSSVGDVGASRMGAYSLERKMKNTGAGVGDAMRGMANDVNEAISNSYEKQHFPDGKDEFDQYYEDKYGEGHLLQQQEGFIGAMDAGGGYTALKYNAEGVAEDTGITNMSEINGGGYKNAFGIEYAMDYDTVSIDKGGYEEQLKPQQEAMTNIVHAFQNPDDNENEVNYYKSQGILGVERNADTGRAWFILDKNKFGVKSVSNSGKGSYVVQKGNTALFTNNAISDVPLYDPAIHKPKEPANAGKKNN